MPHADPAPPAASAPSWSARARWQGTGPVALSCRGEPLEALVSGGVSLTPVEYLLLGAAGCFALSLEGARRAQGFAVAAFEVSAIGTKASAAPSQLAALVLRVRVEGPIPGVAIPALVAAAKLLCTVTNTLGVPPTIEIEAAPGAP